jgi:hypothetical protein
MNKHIEESSWEENIKHYPPKTDWVVVLVTVAVIIAGGFIILSYGTIREVMMLIK